MKRIGILSIHYGTWMPGPSLQSAALSHVIQSMGHKTEHIDFIPMRTKPVSKAVLQIQYRNRFAENPEVFEKFRQHWVPRTKTTYRSFEDLEQGKFDYDLVIVGSDSVWAPTATGTFLRAYFLSFLSTTIKRAAYAASFGQTDWEYNLPNDDLLEALNTYLKNFSAIGVREEYGVKPLKNMTEAPVEAVLEPSLIVEEEFFKHMLPETPKTQAAEIAYHKILKDNQFSDKLSLIENHLGLSSENIYTYEKKTAHGEIKYFYNPMDEWLYKINHCKIVITDSFHVLCMAIIFEKEFLFLPSDADPNRLNRPSKNLLTKLGLLDRICYTTEDIVPNLKNGRIDFLLVKKRLDRERNLSINFLKRLLKI